MCLLQKLVIVNTLSKVFSVLRKTDGVIKQSPAV